MATLKTIAAKYIADYFSEQKGFLLKLGQFLGNRSNASDQFKELSHSSSHPIDFSEIENEIAASYSDYRSIFVNINPNGIAASLSQVHQATLNTGEIVAIKIKHKNIDKEIEKWLQRLSLIPNFGPIKKWQVGIVDFIEEFRFTFKRELNFNREITLLSDMKRRLEAFKDFKIPDIYPNLCKKDIIVMSWESGEYLAKIAAGSDLGAKQKLAELMVELFLRQILQLQLFQTDFNPGNFIYRDGQLVILDGGSFLEIPERYSAAFYKILSSNNLPEELCFDIFTKLDFDADKLHNIKRYLPQLCELFATPFAKNQPFNITSWKLKEKIAELLKEDKWWFRSAGSPQFFHVLRSFALLANFLESLNCNINYFKILNNIISDINTNHYESFFNKTIPQPSSSIEERFLAQIKITDSDNQPVAEVKFLISNVKELVKLIPDSIRKELADIDEQERSITEKFLARSELPVEVFAYISDTRNVKITVMSMPP